MREVFVVAGCRTAVGRFGGALRDVPAADLAAAVTREAVSRAGVPADAVDEVILGCVGQSAEDAYVARVAALRAGLPVSCGAQNVNRACGSGLQAIVSAAQTIRAEEGEVLVAGGVESMSRLPFHLRDTRWRGLRLGEAHLDDGAIALLTDPFGHGHMGCTAEAVAERYGVGREAQDGFALRSHRRAVAAIDAGRFAGQIVPIGAAPPAADRAFAIDEQPRRATSMEALARLPPAFVSGGTVTAGNASPLNDGAAALVLASEDAVRALGLRPRLRYVATSRAGCDPRYMGFAPAHAIPRALERSGLSASDLSVVELNEAFAAQAVAVMRETGLDPERTNPNGGAIAIGHPLGATAAILTVKLLYELERVDGRYGLVSMCIGGGQALATVFERA